MKIRPLNDWVVIVPDTAEARTAGGLFIPDTAQNKPDEGVVEAVGPGALEEKKPPKRPKGKKQERKFLPTTVRPGDRVCYEKYAGRRITVGQVEYVLVRERNILGVMPEDLRRELRNDPPPLLNPLMAITAGGKELMKRAAGPVALAGQHRTAALKPAKPTVKPARKAKKAEKEPAKKKAVQTKAAKTKTTKKRASSPAAKAGKRSGAKKGLKKR